MQRPTIYSLSREAITCIGHHLLYSEDASGPEALVNLATTCRYLSDPLLDVIWRELPDIIPLLRLLPSELCTTTLEETPLEPWYERRKEFILLREPVASDFRRMAVYSLRIKTIWYQNGSVYKLRHEDYKIAPCIWDMPRIADNLCLENHPNFHNDNLDNLDFSLGICSSPFSANEVILGITRFAPRVKELYWFGDTIFAPWQVKGPDIRTLSSLSKLHALNVRVAPDALWAVGTLPHLRQLEVRLDFFETEWNEWDAFPHGRAAGLFPTLTQLKVKAAGPLGTIALMETITSSSLAQLAISITQQIAPELLLGVLCSSLSSSPFQQALRSLILVVDTGVLQPLLCLPQLQTLRFRSDFPIAFVNDAFIQEMSRAWPEIRVLRFGELDSLGYWSDFYRADPRIGAPDCPKATLAGLVPLAVHCPHLEELEIPIDMRIPSKPLEPARGRPSPINKRVPWHGLHTFHAGECVLGDRMRVASFLASLFPSIEKMEFRNRKQAWRAMNDIYDQLVDIRYEECMWHRGAKC